MNLLTIVVGGVIFLYQKHRLKQDQALVLALQTLHVPQVAGLELLVLRSTLGPIQSPGKSQGQLIIEFSNNYCLLLLGLVILLAVMYKAWRVCFRWWPREVSSHATRSSVVLHMFDGSYGVYIRLLELDRVHSQIMITSQGSIENLVLVGCLLPTMTFTWTMSLHNNITGVITCPARAVRVSWRQGWRFCHLMRTEFRTEVYLLTGSELRVFRDEAAAVVEPVVEQGVGLEYTPIHSPRRGAAMGAMVFCTHFVS